MLGIERGLKGKSEIEIHGDGPEIKTYIRNKKEQNKTRNVVSMLVEYTVRRNCGMRSGKAKLKRGGLATIVRA